MYFLQVIFSKKIFLGLGPYNYFGCTKIGSLFPVYSLGYASDGGLYFPDTIHKLSEEEISHWSDLEYIDLVKVNYFQDFFISMDYLIRFYIAIFYFCIDRKFLVFIYQKRKFHDKI